MPPHQRACCARLLCTRRRNRRKQHSNAYIRGLSSDEKNKKKGARRLLAESAANDAHLRFTLICVDARPPHTRKSPITRRRRAVALVFALAAGQIAHRRTLLRPLRGYDKQRAQLVRPPIQSGLDPRRHKAPPHGFHSARVAVGDTRRQKSLRQRDRQRA